MATSVADVVQILTCLDEVGVPARVGGGWGIDALLGRQTREHRDLDIALPAELTTVARQALSDLGFRVSTDWLPVRIELSNEDRHLDVHPLHFREDGSAWQAGLEGTRFDYPADAWTWGHIGGQKVVCLSEQMQRRFHAGYELRDIDRADLSALDGRNPAAAATSGAAPRVGTDDRRS